MTSQQQHSDLLPNISVRGGEGTYLLAPNGTDYSQLSKFNDFKDDNKNCRASAFDPLGQFFAYCTSTGVAVIDLKADCKLVCQLDRPRTSYLKFSSRGSYLTVWETFHISKSANADDSSFNLNLYEVRTGQLFKSILQKKQMENFVDWSADETVFAYASGKEVQFYETTDPNKSKCRFKLDNLQTFSLNPVSKIAAIHGAGKKSEPSTVKIVQYPHIDRVLASKSFFQADRIEFKWNKSGNNVLLLCNTETSENSYYGDSTLHQIRLPAGGGSGKEPETQSIQLSKKGPIYALEWNPCKDEFIVVYGNMPAKATLFNAAGSAIFDFGTGSRNELFFSPHGNVVCLAGFGNLRGTVETWNMQTQNKVPAQLGSFTADDTTYFSWSPDGEHLMTATTAPRLRVSNGFTVWAYSGEKKFTYAMPDKQELWRVEWQPGSYPQKSVIQKAEGVAVKQEAQAYVPPHLRGAKKPANFKSKLHEDDEKPDSKLKKVAIVPGSVEETEKKIKTLKKKLTQVDDLKKRRNGGEKLEKNQLDKLNSEKDLLADLKKLEIKV